MKYNCWFRYNYFIEADNIEEAEKKAQEAFIKENLKPETFIEKAGFDYKVIQEPVKLSDIPF